MAFPTFVKIVEVGPRDGLQNEAQALSVSDRVTMIQGLVEAGLTVIEVGSFVSPKWVPQMADTDAVLKTIPQKSGVHYPVLIPNVEGLKRALAVGVKDMAVFIAASETFSQKNTHCSIAESLVRVGSILGAARRENVRVRGYVSCVLGCPYEGAVNPNTVAELAAQLWQTGCEEISLGDTIGVGTPFAARELVKLVAEQIPLERIALHFHNTYGQALANIYACLELGVGILDTSLGGLGGCPYAQGAGGNVATEDVVYMLSGMGIRTNVDLNRLVALSRWLFPKLGKNPPSSVALALSCKSPHT